MIKLDEACLSMDFRTYLTLEIWEGMLKEIREGKHELIDAFLNIVIRKEIVDLLEENSLLGSVKWKS